MPQLDKLLPLGHDQFDDALGCAGERDQFGLRGTAPFKLELAVFEAAAADDHAWLQAVLFTEIRKSRALHVSRIAA